MSAVVGGIVGWLGSEAVKNVLKKTVVIIAMISFLGFLMVALGIPSVVLPNSLFSKLVDPQIGQIFKAVDFFIPVGFIMLCFLTILGFRLISFLWSLASWIYFAFKDSLAN